jgi:hypothetical protein
MWSMVTRAFSIALFVSGFVVRLAATSHAQSNAQGAAVITGLVRDSTSGRPAQKAFVCALITIRRALLTSRCAPVDTAGTYRLDSLPMVGMRISVQCEMIRSLGKSLASDSVFVGSLILHRDWAVGTAGCDPRPVRRVSGVFRGHYTPGFESSEFVPCPTSAWFLPADSLDGYPYDAHRAWVEWSIGFMREVSWPTAPRDTYGNSRYYVRWRGTVLGPGRYGHLGVSAFEFRVDSVFEVRAPRRRDCE